MNCDQLSDSWRTSFKLIALCKLNFNREAVIRNLFALSSYLETLHRPTPPRFARTACPVRLGSPYEIQSDQFLVQIRIDFYC